MTEEQTISVSGVCYDTIPSPTINGNRTTDGYESGFYVSILSNLKPSKTYYVRAYATNSAGTAYGNELSFTTAAPSVPVPITFGIENITDISANCSAELMSDGGSSVTDRGICWSTTSGPTIALPTKFSDGAGTGFFIVPMTGLTPSTMYYVRSYATNSVGTGYGNEVTFTTTAGGTSVTDIEGNIYNIVTIGSQTWMAENLKTTLYNDGTPIPKVVPDASWSILSTPGYIWYNNDSVTYKPTYGALYNWYAVNTGNLCPTGWHVPTEAEWGTLTSYLGGNSVAGGKLKETGLIHWNSPNDGATNEVGFNGLPGGFRAYMGPYVGIGSEGRFWTSSEYTLSDAYYLTLNSNNPMSAPSFFSKLFGHSVRCIQGAVVVAAPAVTTGEPSSITMTDFSIGGTVNSDGGSTVIARGVCYSTSPNPTLANSFTSDGTGNGPFVSSVTSLTPGVLYYVRSYATNSAGTNYGNEVSFSTALTTGTLPSVSTSTVTPFSASDGSGGGNVMNEGSAPVTSKGVCWSTVQGGASVLLPTKTTDGTGPGSFTSIMTSLVSGTKYYVKAYAISTVGVGYGPEVIYTQP